jgi:16S rRNA (uracil1498-N3)-methyltransferase
MHRFYLPTGLAEQQSVMVPPDQAKHLRSVLRLSPGDTIELFDGQGNLFLARLEEVQRHQVQARCLERLPLPPAPRCPLTLMQSLLKGKKMDLVVQKATELGAVTLQPIISRYSESSLAADRIERWHRISLEACKQCGRPTPLTIREPLALESVPLAHYIHRLYCWEQEGSAQLGPAMFQPGASTCLLIGPEGGLHSAEIQWLTRGAFHPLGLGPLTLRAETASLAAITLVQFLAGNWHPPESAGPI